MEINKIYCENNLDTMARMPDDFVDLTLTSPPYNMLTQVKYNKYIRRILPSHKFNKYNAFDDGMTVNDFHKLHSEILAELLRVSKVVLYNFQIVSGSKEAFFKIIGDFNTYIKDIIVWDKGRSLPASRDKILNSGYEMILVMEGNQRLGRTINNATFERCQLDNIVRVDRKKATIDGVKHNAVFPEELCDILIKSFSSEGGLVYDPFMGTGTTAKMALLNNRNYIGSEISKEYVEISERRLEITKEKENQFNHNRETINKFFE